MTDDDIPALQELLSVPSIAELYGISDVAVRRGIQKWRWYRIHPDPAQSEVVKILSGKNWSYLVRRYAVYRELRRRQQKAEKPKPKEKEDAAREWRVRFRDWSRSHGMPIRMDADLPEDVIQRYVEAHPDDKPPEGYAIVPRSLRQATQ
jgi:hypothetical protein